MNRSIPSLAIAFLYACTTTQAEEPSRGRDVVERLDEVEVPPDGPTFVPETYREGGRVVMPITFPDGSRAELVYPPRLDLTALRVAPDAYLRMAGQVGGRGCGLDLIISRSGGHGEIVKGRPVATYEGAMGQAVGLWSPTKSWEPYHWLVFTFGQWNVFLPCDQAPSPDPADQGIRETQAAWARSLRGHQTPSGFLALDPAPPLRFLDEQTVRLSSRHVVIDIHVGRYKPLQDRHVGTDGLAQWVEGDGRIRVYALAFSDFRKGFIRDVASSLRVRNVRVA